MWHLCHPNCHCPVSISHHPWLTLLQQSSNSSFQSYPPPHPPYLHNFAHCVPPPRLPPVLFSPAHFLNLTLALPPKGLIHLLSAPFQHIALTELLSCFMFVSLPTCLSYYTASSFGAQCLIHVCRSSIKHITWNLIGPSEVFEYMNRWMNKRTNRQRMTLRCNIRISKNKKLYSFYFVYQSYVLIRKNNNMKGL